MSRDRTWHVVHLIGALSTGGAERSVVNYLLNADRLDFRHTVVCLGARGELAPVVEAIGIGVHVERIRRRYLLPGLLRLARWMRRERVDVVHAHMFDAALYGRIASLIAGVPVTVLTEHGPELWKGPVHIALDRWLNSMNARHIAVAHEGLELRVRRERVRPDRITVIPNGVDIPAASHAVHRARRAREEFGLAPDAPVIGSVGRFVPAKGYHHLLAAFLLARKDVPDLRWLAIGDGDLRASIAAQAKEAGLENAVVWAGMRSDVEAILPSLNLWVMSSVEEGLPVALLEAMAAGCAIVATRVGGIPDAVKDGREATLVPAADPSALAEAIVDLLRNPEKARRLGDAARRRAEAEYSIQSVARRIEAIYREELGCVN